MNLWIQKYAELQQAVARAKSFAAELEKKGEDATKEEHEQLAGMLTEAKALREEIERLKNLEALDGFVNGPNDRRTSDRLPETKTPGARRGAR